MLLSGGGGSAIFEEVIPLELVTALVMTAFIEDGRLLNLVDSEVTAEPPVSAFLATASAAVDMLEDDLVELELVCRLTLAAPRSWVKVVNLDEPELLCGFKPAAPWLWVKAVRVEVELYLNVPVLLSSAVADTVEVLMEWWFTVG